MRKLKVCEKKLAKTNIVPYLLATICSALFVKRIKYVRFVLKPRKQHVNKHKYTLQK